MRHSLKIKITLVLSAAIVLLVLLCLLLNNLFLPRYYQVKKTDSLEKIYLQLEELARNSGFNSEDGNMNNVEKLETNSNISIYILGLPKLSFVYPTSIEYYFDNGRPHLDNRIERVIGTLQKYIFGLPNDKDQVNILKTVDDKYNIFEMFDSQVDSKYLDLVGYIDDRYMIFLRTSFSNISESASVSNNFLAISGIFVVIIGAAVMFFFSKSLTKPIMKLSEISKDMTGLNFQSRYTGKRKDEIGELGRSINRLSDKLEETISELQSANNQLTKDIAQKDEVDRMRREFLSNVSHELKTPIALIQGYAEGLADNINEDEESRQFYCEVIMDEAQKMNSMVKKLISLNKIEFGNVKLDMERFDIVELTSSVAQSFDILAKQKEVQVVFNPIDPVYVWADQYMIEEVVTNYLSNAFNHIDGKKIIDISFRKTEDGIRVIVFNTGEKIPADDIDNIWEKFYKVDKARTREYGGSGIGLSIVKAVIQSHNGSFGVKNHDAGVEFWFELKIEQNFYENSCKEN